MKKIFFGIICSMGTLITYATNNDFGADEEINKNTYYYFGNQKVNLFYDSDRVIVFDFVDQDNLKKSKEKILKKYPCLEFEKHINAKNVMMNSYRVKSPNVNIGGCSESVKVFDCYKDKTGVEAAPNGYINIELKNESQFPILLKYAENFNCRYIGRDQYDPLWCTLEITEETRLSPIDIANQLYETGIFSVSEPGFYTFDMLEISYDTQILEQWGLYNAQYPSNDISASEVWGYSTGRGIRIAIIDSSIDYMHEDLKDNISTLSYDACLKKTPCTKRDTNSHGTHCAGIIAATRNNNLQICGVAPDSELMTIRVDLDDTNAHLQIADGINWATTNGADIILCAWGSTSDSRIKKALDNALYNGRNGKGCVVVTSAGNKGNENGEITFPGNYNKDVITVGGINPWGSRVSTSSYGDYMFVCAPGYDILSTVPGNKTEKASGTSTAAPHVAGVAALILSRNPDLTMKQVKEIIGSNTNDISTEKQTQKEFGMWDPKYGYGLVDAAKCVKATPRKE